RRDERWRDRRGRGGRSDSTSPDGRWDVRVRGHNLYLRDTKKEEERQITFDGNPGHSYARNARRERYVEMRYDARDEESPTPEVYWSSDSRHFVAMGVRPGMERTVYMVDSSPDDQLQPKLESYPYLKPGDEIPIKKPHLFEAESGRHTPLKDELF